MTLAVADRRRPRIVAADDFEAAHADQLRGEVNLDYAATAPALRAAIDAIMRLLPAPPRRRSDGHRVIDARSIGNGAAVRFAASRCL